MGMPMISWPRLDYELTGDPIGAAIRETVGYDWNIETAHLENWTDSYSLFTEEHNDPVMFRVEIDNLKEIHTLIFPQHSAIRGRLNKLKFKSLFDPLEKLCAGTIPTTSQTESDEWATASLDAATTDAIKLKIYQAVHEIFADAERLNDLFDLTIFAADPVSKIALMTVILYVRFYAYRRRVGPRESQRQKLGTVLVTMYWQMLLMGFTTKAEHVDRPFPPQMALIAQAVAFAAQMEQQVRQVDFARLLDADANADAPPVVREAGELAVQAGVTFGLLDEQGRLVEVPGFHAGFSRG